MSNYLYNKNLKFGSVKQLLHRKVVTQDDLFYLITNVFSKWDKITIGNLIQDLNRIKLLVATGDLVIEIDPNKTKNIIVGYLLESKESLVKRITKYCFIDTIETVYRGYNFANIMMNRNSKKISIPFSIAPEAKQYWIKHLIANNITNMDEFLISHRHTLVTIPIAISIVDNDLIEEVSNSKIMLH